MSDFLAGMAASSRIRAERVRAAHGASGLSERVASAPPVLPLNLSGEGFDLIAEAKLASPSDGRLVAAGPAPSAVVNLAVGLVEAGAAAISVLTEPTRFDGDVRHLESVASKVGVPVMRKDFLVDTIQVVEARAAGASGVLLIARMVGGELLEEMVDVALGLEMFVLVELFEEPDLEVASVVFDRDVLVGVNARDLATLEVDPGRHRAFAPLLPSDLPSVAESGVQTAQDAADLAGLGYRLALVGTSLVVSPDPPELASELIRAGREAATVGEHL